MCHATTIESVHGHEAGPADAVDRNTQSSNAREDDDSTLPHEDDEHLGGAGVGIIDGSGETLEDPIVLWDNALRNRKIIEELEAASLRAEKTALSSSSRADANAAAHAQKHAEAVKAAVQALRKPASQEAQAVLRKFDLLYHGDEPNILHIGHEEDLLSNFLPPSGHIASYISLVAAIVPSGIAVASLVPIPRILDNGRKSGPTVSCVVLISLDGVSASTS